MELDDSLKFSLWVLNKNIGLSRVNDANVSLVLASNSIPPLVAANHTSHEELQIISSKFVVCCPRFITTHVLLISPPSFLPHLSS